MRILSWDIGMYNLSYCIIETIDNNKENMRIIEWDVIDLTNNDDRLKKNEVLLYNNIPIKLSEYPNLLDNIDYVVIENQPSMKNPKMKSVQMIVFTYFIIHGIQLRTSPESHSIKKIDFCSAMNKLKIYDGPDIIFTDKKGVSKNMSALKPSKLKYSEKKKVSVEHCKYFLNKHSLGADRLEFLSTYKKKDDLSDCFLQCLYYIGTL